MKPRRTVEQLAECEHWAAARDSEYVRSCGSCAACERSAAERKAECDAGGGGIAAWAMEALKEVV